MASCTIKTSCSDVLCSSNPSRGQNTQVTLLHRDWNKTSREGAARDGSAAYLVRWTFTIKGLQGRYLAVYGMLICPDPFQAQQ